MKLSILRAALVGILSYSHFLIAADSNKQLHELQRALFWDLGVDSWSIGNIATQKKFGEGTYAQRTGAPLPQFNTVFAHGAVNPHDVDEVFSYMNNAPFRWWVAGDRHELDKLLLEKGFTFIGEEYLMKAIYNADDHPSPWVKTKIQRVINETQMETWQINAARGMGLDEQAFAVFVKHLVSHADLFKMEFYIAYTEEGLPAATLMASQSQDMAGVVSLFSTIDEKNNYAYKKDLLQSRLVKADNFESDVILLTSFEQKTWLENLSHNDVIPLQPFKEVQTFRVYEKNGTALPILPVTNSSSTCGLF